MASAKLGFALQVFAAQAESFDAVLGETTQKVNARNAGQGRRRPRGEPSQFVEFRGRGEAKLCCEGCRLHAESGECLVRNRHGDLGHDWGIVSNPRHFLYCQSFKEPTGSNPILRSAATTWRALTAGRRATRAFDLDDEAGLGRNGEAVGGGVALRGE